MCYSMKELNCSGCILMFICYTDRMKIVLLPYLNFMGQTQDAMEFYKSVLGGELKMQSFVEAGMQVSPEDKDNIVHASLENEALSFMASDGNAEHQYIWGTILI